MKIALDPYMLRGVPLTELPGVVADLGYEYIELSPRADFTPFFLHPRANQDRVREFKAALDAAGVAVASHLPLYRWSGPDEDERQAAVRYWKRAIELTVDLGCDVMNSEFNGRPEAASRSEAQFWRSMEELLPVFEREGIKLRLEPHPDDFVEDGVTAVDMIRGINSANVSFLYCAAHVPHGRQHDRDHGLRRRPAHAPAPGRLLRPHRVVGAALHRQPARVGGAGASAPRHRPGGGRLGRVLRHAGPVGLRRHRHRLRLRVGGPGPGVVRRQPGEGTPVPGQVLLSRATYA